MDWIGTLEREGHLLSAAARHDPKAAVPTCPGWDVDELLAHVSTTHRWAARILRERRTERTELEEAPSHGRLDWYEAGLATLLDALRGTDPSTPVWTFSAADRTAQFWFRRQAHETCVHRVDAELATGAVTAIDPAFAADGIAESLEVFAPRVAKGASAAGGTIHVHTTDVEGEWLIRFGEGTIDVELGHAKGDAAVRGPAAQLYLWLWGRADASGLEVFGDESVPPRLLALTRV